MKVKEFYEKMKDIIEETVVIMNGNTEKYSGVMREKKVYEYLYEFNVKNIYIGIGGVLVVEI